MADPDLNPYRKPDGGPKMLRSVAAFIDFLGYQHYIDTAFKNGTGQEELTRLRNALHSAYFQLKESSKWPVLGDKRFFETRFFTDNLVIGCPIPDPENEVSPVLTMQHYISTVQLELAIEGYFIRGAIAIGDLYIDEEIVFGPALMEAYRAEQQIAVYPRIVICGKASEALEKEKKWAFTDGRVPGVLMDYDGLPFVDYLGGAAVDTNTHDYIDLDCLAQHKFQIESKLQEFQANPRVREKYEWAAHYHNTFCDLHPSYIKSHQKIDSQALMPHPRPWRTGAKSGIPD